MRLGPVWSRRRSVAGRVRGEATLKGLRMGARYFMQFGRGVATEKEGA